MAQRQRGGRKDRGGWAGITLAGEDVENDIGGMNAVSDCLGCSSLAARKTGSVHRTKGREK